MKKDVQSKTSELIAVCRAIHAAQHEAPILVDPYAHRLVRPLWRLAARSRFVYGLYRAAGIRLEATIAACMARSRIAEDRFDALSAAGEAQWVLLGAGLDTFAWRRAEHADRPQFEVDHPATQRNKRKRIAALGLVAPAAHRFVPVDFEREQLSARLLEAGFNPAIPAVFAWLGVVQYLTRAAIETTLRDVASIAASGSTIVFDFRLPDHHASPEERPLLALGDETFARWGEPVISLLEISEWRDIASRTGWQILAVHGKEEIVSRFYKDRKDGLAPLSVACVIELLRPSRPLLT